MSSFLQSHKSSLAARFDSLPLSPTSPSLFQPPSNPPTRFPLFPSPSKVNHQFPRSLTPRLSPGHTSNPSLILLFLLLLPRLSISLFSSFLYAFVRSFQARPIDCAPLSTIVFMPVGANDLHLCIHATTSLLTRICLSLTLCFSLCLSLSVSLGISHSLSVALCLCLSMSLSFSLSLSLCVFLSRSLS